jgi:hypothetical protein
MSETVPSPGKALIESTKMWALPGPNKAVELTPAAQAFCGMCRSCMNTNIASGLVAAGLFVTQPLVRVTARLRREERP